MRQALSLMWSGLAPGYAVIVGHLLQHRFVILNEAKDSMQFASSQPKSIGPSPQGTRRGMTIEKP
jgi:hypothetical protein